jgi:uncharacterized protein YdaU (DUF1376 family)
MKSLPYFPFYPGEWLRSPTVLGMSLLEQGAYLRLLCVQWEDGFVDPEDVALILGLDDAAVIEMFSRRPWKRAFPKCEDGMLRNPRLAIDREAAAHKVEGARNSAKARWEKHRKEGKPKVVRKDADKELAAAIARMESEGVTLPESLQRAMFEYKEARKESKCGVWSTDQWLRNLDGAFSFEEWEEAYRTAARSGWKSVHPKKAPVKKTGNKALNTIQEWVSDEELPY